VVPYLIDGALPKGWRQNGDQRQVAGLVAPIQAYADQFRQELLGDAKPKPSERTLIEQAALAAPRAREMRDEIIAGKRIEDDDFVRLIRATSAVMKAFREHAVTAKPKLSLLQQKMIRDGKL
jgi:hypothetical protein